MAHLNMVCIYCLVRSGLSSTLNPQGDNSSALSDGEASLSLDSSYMKGYYRTAAALSALNKYKEAKDILIKGSSLFDYLTLRSYFECLC